MDKTDVAPWYRVFVHAVIFCIPFTMVVKGCRTFHRIVWYVLIMTLLPLYYGIQGSRTGNFSAALLAEFIFISIPFLIVGEIVFFITAMIRHRKVEKF